MVIWEISEWDDYYSIKETNTFNNGMYISIPKRITDRVFKKVCKSLGKKEKEGTK